MGKKHASQYANFGWLQKGFYFNGRIYEYGNKVKLLQRYFFKCFENLFHN